MPLHIVDHPLVKHKLGILRRHDLPVREFRAVSNELCRLLTYEATKQLETEKTTVQGWAGPVEVHRIKGKKITVVPILRAGLGMLDGFLDMIPGAKVGIVGMFRDEETLKPVQYYVKLAKNMSRRMAVVLDPMLATGGSASAAVKFMKEVGCKHIKLMCIIGAPEGVAVMQKEHPDVDIYVAALDDHLNEHGYIVPGLGDAGDRIFGTK